MGFISQSEAALYILRWTGSELLQDVEALQQ